MDGRVITKFERRRGCGYRKKGGIYLVGSGMAMTCKKLPLPLDVCPACHSGIKPSRGFTYINANELFKEAHEQYLLSKGEFSSCSFCPIITVGTGDPKWDKVGLLWIGERFYPTPQEFIAEAGLMEISRRIPAVPRDFKVGETWVFLAHRKAVPGKFHLWFPNEETKPGIFYIFRPTAVEIVVNGDETEEEIDRLIQRGLTPVKVERAEDPEQESISNEPQKGQIEVIQ